MTDAAAGAKGISALPVRGLHFAAPRKPDLPDLLDFIRNSLPKEKATHLVIEFNYGYAYRSHPDLAQGDDLLDEADVKQALAAARESGVRLVPQFQCLGHQGNRKRPSALLRKHPEFNEAPGADVAAGDFYCPSWCPGHPELHKVVFALIDELADACETDAVHLGLDEIFIIADDDCPRCAGSDPAEVFAREVTRLRDHLNETGRTMWMWGDRFIDSMKWRTGKWSGSENGTFPAVDKVPADIVICDWHYAHVPKTAEWFMEKGFSVITSPWQKTAVALGQQNLMGKLAGREGIGERSLGVLATTWCGFRSFLDAYRGRPVVNDNAAGAANCFKVLGAAWRGEIDCSGYGDLEEAVSRV